MGKKEKNLVSFYIEGDTCQRQAERGVTSKLNKLPYEGILFGVEISDPSNYIFNDLFKKFWIRIKEKIQDPLIQTMVFRLAYLDEAFESLCIRNDFSIKNTYLPILNKEQEEKYPDDYQYYKKELAIALAFEEFEWLSDQEKFALPMTSKDMLRKEWIKMVYEYISEEDKEELLKMLFETNEGLCQKLNLTPKNSLY